MITVAKVVIASFLAEDGVLTELFTRKTVSRCIVSKGNGNQKNILKRTVIVGHGVEDQGDRAAATQTKW
ncbi:MAG: hypothetical protein IPH20_19150 [Bacteroidales bacterium]|nr:hypothetical protein [Bacteroidales bacterium]